jgi:hypothetical protein
MQTSLFILLYQLLTVFDEEFLPVCMFVIYADHNRG